jgi:DNA-binding CsgD family transcriptional regulator
VVRLDPRAAEDRLADAANGCTTEVIMMQSRGSGQPRAALSVRPLVLAAARRGVRVRLIYPHAGRGDTVTRAYLTDVAASGGQVRTCDGVFDRFVVFDRATAFILASADSEAGEDRGADEHGHPVAVADEPIVAGLLCRMHQHVWQSATPFVPRRPGYGEALGLLKSSIIGLLAAGLTDDAIARRVGMSERTLRRHIAALMRDMSAESRFQAGVAVARAGLIEPARAAKPNAGHDEDP